MRKEVSSWRRLAGYLATSRARIVAGLAALVVVVASKVVLPLVVGRGFFDGALLGKGDLSQLNRLVLWLIGLYAMKGLFQFLQSFLLAGAGHRAVTDLRADVHQGLQRLSLAFYQDNRSGELVSRVTADIGLIQNTVTTGLAEFLHDAALVTGLLAMAFWIHWKLALFAVLALPPAVLAIQSFGRRIRRYTRVAQERVADIAAILQEGLTAARVVKAFSLEGQQQRRFEQSNEQGYAASLRSARAVAAALPVAELLTITAMGVVVYGGAREVLAGRLTPGDLVAFLSYLGMIGGPVSGLTRGYSSLQQAMAAADRVFQILDHEPDVVEVAGAKALGPIRGEVAFRGVSFAYRSGGVEALNGVDLVVQPGEVIAVVGPSGAGKSTLVNLIPRFYDPTEGRVEIDGVDIRTVTLASLRQQVGLVPQETILFNATMRENIAAGRPGASLEEVIEAARTANAHEFILQLPEGYDTVISEGGANLSGGQRQRIAIARVILRNPRVLVLDEATSALDARAEMEVQEALRRLMRGRTTFIIAHRLSTVMDAHRIVVMDRGRILQLGTHEELMAQKGLYRKLFEAQLRLGRPGGARGSAALAGAGGAAGGGGAAGAAGDAGAAGATGVAGGAGAVGAAGAAGVAGVVRAGA